VIGGPLTDFLGELLLLDDNGRVRVLLEIMPGDNLDENLA